MNDKIPKTICKRDREFAIDSVAEFDGSLTPKQIRVNQRARIHTEWVNHGFTPFVAHFYAKLGPDEG